ncbi:hypothetical protein STEG23_010136, partial [Scotinomys teguina]
MFVTLGSVHDLSQFEKTSYADIHAAESHEHLGLCCNYKMMEEECGHSPQKNPTRQLSLDSVQGPTE